MKKTTPHTVFIYQHGNFLRVVRGEHPITNTTVKARRYDTIGEALKKERNPRVVSLLQAYFPSDTLLDRRLKRANKPVKVEQFRTLADAIRSPLFLYAQVGYDSNHQEVAHIFHRSPTRQTGLTFVKSGPVNVTRKLLKRYRKPAIRELDYVERKPRMKSEAA